MDKTVFFLETPRIFCAVNYFHHIENKSYLKKEKIYIVKYESNKYETFIAEFEAELHPFICMINLINKEVRNRKH